MPFIDLPLDEVKEQQIVPEGNYELKVSSVPKEKKNEETGRTTYGVAVQILNPPADIENPSAVFVNLSLPIASDDPSVKQMMLLQIKRFLATFDIPAEGGFDPQDFPGATAECLVVCSYNDYMKREVNELSLPRLEDE